MATKLLIDCEETDKASYPLVKQPPKLNPAHVPSPKVIRVFFYKLLV